MTASFPKSLVILGSGIKTISHLTTESIPYIEKSDIVLYLVNEPILKEWITKYSQKSMSLDDIYFSTRKRIEAYKKISEFVCEQLDVYDRVCFVLYGHPTTFAEPGLAAATSVGKTRTDTEVIILPGVSALDCLLCDLRLDPSVRGCFSVEANELLLYNKRLDKSVHNIVWQVGMIGNIGAPTYTLNRECLDFLKEYLLEVYDESHILILYEASIFPFKPHKEKRFELKNISKQEFTPLSTIYIPPVGTDKLNMIALERLGLSRKDLQ